MALEIMKTKDLYPVMSICRFRLAHKWQDVDAICAIGMGMSVEKGYQTTWMMGVGVYEAVWNGLGLIHGLVPASSPPVSTPFPREQKNGLDRVANNSLSR